MFLSSTFGVGKFIYNPVNKVSNPVIEENNDDSDESSIHSHVVFASKYNAEISTIKTKAMDFAGKNPIRSKIIINDIIIKLVWLNIKIKHNNNK